MTSALHKLSQQKHRLFAAAKRSGTTTTWQAYQQTRNLCNIAFKKAKSTFMKQQQDKLSTLADGSSVWWRKAKALARISAPAEQIPNLTSNGQTLTQPKEKADALARYFAQQCTAPATDKESDHCPAPFPLQENQPTFNFPAILPRTVHRHLRRLSQNKSTADQVMTNRVLRECASSITESVTYLFNLSVSTGTFPSAWKNAIVIPVFKRRGRDSDPSNYRPVSLLPPLGKVLDAIQSEHLLSFLEKNDLLSKHQFGFLPHRSTVMQLIYVADTWMTAVDRGKQPSAVFMDFKKAFDRVWHTGLLHKLAKIGVAPPSLSWISDFLTKRTISVRVGSTLSPQHTISAGVPQGSHLGPVLFLVFINDLPSHVHLPTELYADDALIHETLTRNTTATNTTALQGAVNNAEQWALSWNGRFGHEKTKLLNIGKTRDTPLVIDSHPIEAVAQHKHLGIIFTPDLKWTTHIQAVIRNASKRAGLLRWMSHHLRGPLTTKLYLSFVRPTMEYASPLWHGSIREEDALQLERIQTAVARCILQAPWRTPKSELLQALDWPSLRWRREIASLCLLHRLLNLQQEPLTNCLPPFASSRNPRSQRKPKQLILPAARTTRHTTSFFFSASVAWNTLPAHIQNLTNAQQFRKALTKHFYSQRFTLNSTISHAQ